MEQDKNMNTIQAMPFVPGNVGLTSTDGALKKVRLIHCVEAGIVTVATDSDSDNLVMSVGDLPRSIPSGAICTITSGIFDVDR